MEKILCVDDEPHVLEAFQRQLRKQFDLELAGNGSEALECLRTQGPFSVIVADMNMPGMNGVQLLAKAREASPDTVRIMLTGAGDFQTAITAVNEGHIFRFLAKPCPAETLALALEAGLAQYRLVTAERELLEKTLHGSLRAMVDILALANPAAFSRAMRLRHYASQMARTLAVPDAWQVEVAAMLSQVGCVTLPADVLEKAIAGEPLTPQEQEMVDAHPQVGGKLIVHIPRMEKVAHMILHQHQPESGLELPEKTDPSYVQEVGSHILRAVVDFDLLLARGQTVEKSKGMIAVRRDRYPACIAGALGEVVVPEMEKVARMAKIEQLRTGMVLAEDVRTKAGALLLQKNQEVSDTLCRRLANFHVQGLVPDEIRVFVYQRSAKEF